MLVMALNWSVFETHRRYLTCPKGSGPAYLRMRTLAMYVCMYVCDQSYQRGYHKPIDAGLVVHPRDWLVEVVV